jgi:hypothetical protein
MPAPDHVLTLYCAVLAKLSQEGDAIWLRFSHLVAVQFSLAGALVLLCSSARPVAGWRGLALGIAILGWFSTWWSHRVLLRLWDRHWHWRDVLVNLQEQFPAGLLSPLEAKTGARQLQRDWARRIGSISVQVAEDLTMDRFLSGRRKVVWRRMGGTTARVAENPSRPRVSRWMPKVVCPIVVISVRVKPNLTMPYLLAFLLVWVALIALLLAWPEALRPR